MAYVFFSPLSWKDWRWDWYTIEPPPGEVFVNGALIKFGHAEPRVDPPNVKYADLFLELFKEARADYRGMWQTMIVHLEENSFETRSYPETTRLK